MIEPRTKKMFLTVLLCRAISKVRKPKQYFIINYCKLSTHTLCDNHNFYHETSWLCGWVGNPLNSYFTNINPED